MAEMQGNREVEENQQRGLESRRGALQEREGNGVRHGRPPGRGGLGSVPRMWPPATWPEQ